MWNILFSKLGPRVFEFEKCVRIKPKGLTIARTRFKPHSNK